MTTNAPRRIADDWHLTEIEEQAEAFRLAVDGSLWERIRFVARQGWGLVAAPREKKPFHGLCLANHLEIGHVPARARRLRNTRRGRRLLARRPLITAAQIDALADLPATTLGGAYARFMRDRNLNVDFVLLPDHLDEVDAYVYQRGANTHDVWHVLVDFDIELEAEVAVSAFIAAQYGGVPLHALLALACLGMAFEFPSLLPVIWRAYRRGLRARQLEPVVFEDWWEADLVDVRQWLGITPESDRRLAMKGDPDRLAA